ncbi:MAG: hypothetical protein RI947_41 [Candidatus Parcubacteria bacterium]|jgi:glycosyltransferase involved in cell wall biosynthesis
MNISLIIPCYNEEANLQKGVLDKIGNYTKDNSSFGEVLVVDDGSTDDSASIISAKYSKRFPKFKLIKNKHMGKAFAIMTGIEKATCDSVMFSDMDLATPIEEATKLIREVEKGFDVVIGSRNTNREGAPFSRKLLALGFIWIRNLLIGLRGIKDTQCGFKMFKTTAARTIISKLQVFKDIHVIKTPSVTAGFDLEFLFLARKLKYKIKEVPVIWRHVETKRVTFIKDSLETLRDIVKIKLCDLSHTYDKAKT